MLLKAAEIQGDLFQRKRGGHWVETENRKRGRFEIDSKKFVRKFGGKNPLAHEDLSKTERRLEQKIIQAPLPLHIVVDEN
jgi:hypothetical protein